MEESARTGIGQPWRRPLVAASFQAALEGKHIFEYKFARSVPLADLSLVSDAGLTTGDGTGHNVVFFGADGEKILDLRPIQEIAFVRQRNGRTEGVTTKF